MGGSKKIASAVVGPCPGTRCFRSMIHNKQASKHGSKHGRKQTCKQAWVEASKECSWSLPWRKMLYGCPATVLGALDEASAEISALHFGERWNIFHTMDGNAVQDKITIVLYYYVNVSPGLPLL